MVMNSHDWQPNFGGEARDNAEKREKDSKTREAMTDMQESKDNPLKALKQRL